MQGAAWLCAGGRRSVAGLQLAGFQGRAKGNEERAFRIAALERFEAGLAQAGREDRPHTFFSSSQKVM